MESHGARIDGHERRFIIVVFLRMGFVVRYQRINPAFAYLTLGHAQLMIEEYHETGWNVGPLERPYGRSVNLQTEEPMYQRWR